MNVADWIVEQLEQLKIEYVFLVPGSQIKALCIALEHCKSIQVIVACHEAGAGYMADGYSRVKKKPAVVLSIGSPGVSNLITSILNAKSDCSKVLYLTGGIATEEKDVFSFQNTKENGSNDSEIIACAIGFSQTCDRRQSIPYMWYNSMNALNCGIPGPAHIIIPQDIQFQEIDNSDVNMSTGSITVNEPLEIRNLEILTEHYLKKKSNICILIGRGVSISGAEGALREFIEKYQIPFVTSLGGKGILPETHPLFIGILGYSGKTNVSHQRALDVLMSQQLEFLLCIGSNLSFFPRLYNHTQKELSAKLVQVNLNAMALERSFPIQLQLKIQIDAKACLDYLNNLEISELATSVAQREYWIQEISRTPLNSYSQSPPKENESIDIIHLIQSLNHFMPSNTLLFIDSGAHAAVAAHYWLTHEGGSVIRASNISPMGFAIPAAIGGRLAAEGQPVIVFTGDGCMRMHGIEIMSAVQYKIPIIVIVCNNSSLGSKDSCKQNTLITDGKMPFIAQANWADFARSLGADGVRIINPKDLVPAYQSALLADGPFVIDVITKY